MPFLYVLFVKILSYVEEIKNIYLSKAVLLLWIIYVKSCFHARLFVDALWSPAGKGLTSWLSFVMSYCDIITFPLVSWVRCGA